MNELGDELKRYYSRTLLENARQAHVFSRFMEGNVPYTTNPFVVGDKVVFDKAHTYNTHARTGSRLWPLIEQNVGGTITRLSGSDGVDVRFDNGITEVGLFAVRFKKPDPRGNAMAVSVAQAQRKRVLDATGLWEREVIVRTRSWSYDGSYGAVEFTEGGKVHKLYTPADTDAYIKDYESRQKPLELTPYDRQRTLGQDVYRFRYQGIDIKAPDGSLWWTEGEAKVNGNRHKQDGKTFTFGVNKFVAF